jgi:hypothetical protein
MRRYRSGRPARNTALLTHYLPLYFPEIERYACSSRSEWLLDLLYAFPTPASISRLPMDEFVKQAPVPQVLRAGSLHTTVRPVPRYYQAIHAR